MLSDKDIIVLLPVLLMQQWIKGSDTIITMCNYIYLKKKINILRYIYNDIRATKFHNCIHMSNTRDIQLVRAQSDMNFCCCTGNRR